MNAPDPIWPIHPCIWCEAETGRRLKPPAGFRVSHSICERHKAELLQQAARRGRKIVSAWTDQESTETIGCTSRRIYPPACAAA